MESEKNGLNDRPPNDKSVTCSHRLHHSLTPAALTERDARVTGGCAGSVGRLRALLGKSGAAFGGQRSGMMQIVRNLEGSQFHILYVTMSLEE